MELDFITVALVEEEEGFWTLLIIPFWLLNRKLESGGEVKSSLSRVKDIFAEDDDLFEFVVLELLEIL